MRGSLREEFRRKRAMVGGKEWIRKGNEVDCRLVNLRGSVQLGTHIRKGGGYVEVRQDAGERRRDSQSTKSFYSRLRGLSCVGRSSVVVVAGEDDMLERG